MAIERGIGKTKYGYRAYVSFKGKVVFRHFPRTTPLRTIREWRAHTLSMARIAAYEAEQGGLTDALPRSPAGWTYLYVIAGQNAVKIGHAADPHARLRSLQTGHAVTLRLLVAVPSHAQVEAALHHKFAHLKTSGEWFAWSTEIEALIAALQAGKCPIALVWDTLRALTPAEQKERPPERLPWKFQN